VEPYGQGRRLNFGPVVVTWLYAPLGSMLHADGGERVVCHACGEQLSAVSAGHLRRHGLDPASYRARLGLNRKASLLAPALALRRREEGRRRWETNRGVRAGLAVGQQMARAGVLYELGAAAQPGGSRRAQGRAAASREGASAALRAHREAQAAARARWGERARGLGFADLADTWSPGARRGRARTGCGWSSGVAGRSRLDCSRQGERRSSDDAVVLPNQRPQLPHKGRTCGDA
jgi:hypothetical protein